MIKHTLLALALAVSSLAHAQGAPQGNASAAKKDLIARLLVLQQPGVEATARGLVEQPAMQLLQQAGMALQRLPTERREAVGQDIQADLRKYVEEATPIVRDRANKVAPTTLGAFLDERFSEDELKQIVALLEAPANKKFQAAFPDMQRVLTEKLVADTRGEIEPKLKAVQASVGQRLGVAPATAASAAGKAPPKK